MSAVEEVWAAMQIAQLGEYPNANLGWIYDSGVMTADAITLLDALDFGTKHWFTDTSNFPKLDLKRAADALDNYLAQRDEETIQVDIPANKDEPVKVTHSLRSLLLALLAIGFAFLNGCTTRPRINATGDVTYHTEQTITIGAAVEPDDLATVGQAFGLASTSRYNLERATRRLR